MENREILVANTKTQKKSKLITDATTLGELKEAMRNEGIDYSGMTFTEGISKTQLLDDSSPLPQNLMWKGQQTNNLVILLTNTKKNIASGAMSRQEAYLYIKGNDLQDAIKEGFGRNFTQVSTSDLEEFIDLHKFNESNKEEDEEEVETPESEETDNEEKDSYEDNEENEDDGVCSLKDYIIDTRVVTVVDSLFVHIAMLADNKALTVKDVKELKDQLDLIVESMEAEEHEKNKELSTSDGNINGNDIDNMINDLGI